MISRARSDVYLPAYIAVEGKFSRARLHGFTPAPLYAVEQASRLHVQMISRARSNVCLPAYIAVEGKFSRARLDGFTPASLYAVEQASRLGIQ